MSTHTDLTRRTVEEMIDLTGKTAIVTGGAMGIGRGIAHRLHEAGAAVLLADLDAKEADAVAEHLNANRDNSAAAVRADVTNPADIEVVVRAAVEHFGGLNILVNNAGIYPFANFMDMDLAAFERVLRVNLVGAFLAVKAAARQMIAQGHGGKIIVVTSIDALHPSMVGLAHYDASKHGAWGFTKAVALELAPHRISVNAIAPGGIKTPGTGIVDEEQMKAFEALIPMHRMGEPDDIGRAALFLASDLSSYMTGAQIVVDGGRLLA